MELLSGKFVGEKCNLEFVCIVLELSSERTIYDLRASLEVLPA